MSLIAYYWNPLHDRDVVNTNGVLDKSETVMAGRSHWQFSHVLRITDIRVGKDTLGEILAWLKKMAELLLSSMGPDALIVLYYATFQYWSEPSSLCAVLQGAPWIQALRLGRRVHSCKLYWLLYSFSTGQTPKALPLGLFKIYRELSSAYIVPVSNPRGCPLDITQHSLKQLKTLTRSRMTSAELPSCFQQAQ